jgi:hypothetical protein
MKDILKGVISMFFLLSNLGLFAFGVSPGSPAQEDEIIYAQRADEKPNIDGNLISIKRNLFLKASYLWRF